MSFWDEFFPPVFGKRRRSRLFGDWFFSDIDRYFEEMFQEMAKDLPREFVRERKLPDGSVVRQFGPYVYGFSMSVGPDGKPVVQEFGNVRPSKRIGKFGPEPRLEPLDAREPLVDVIEETDQLRVLVELPGVEKHDIKTSCADDVLTIRVDTASRKYYKEVELPAKVDPDTSKASYNNGVLEITLRKVQPKPRGREIKID